MDGTIAQLSAGTVSPAHALVARNYPVRFSRKLCIIHKFASGTSNYLWPLH
jgi:hypothetical protein